MARAKIRRPIKIHGQTRWISGDTEQEYAENLMKAMGETNGESSSPAKHLFREYAQNWFDVFSKPNVSEVTAVTYERQLRLHINPVIGDSFIEDVTPADIQRVFNGMGDVTKATKDKMRIVMNQIFEQAVDEGLRTQNPLKARSIRVTGEGSKPTQVYALETMQDIAGNLDKITNPTDRTFAALMALHPLRQEEALGLKWADIDLDAGVIHVRRAVTHPTRNQPVIKETKTEGSARELALVREIIPYLTKGADDEFVLGGKKPLTCTMVRRVHERIKRDLNLTENMNSIRYRTTVLTDLYDQTKDIKQTQAAAGHTTAAMTLKHYVKGRKQSDATASAIAAAYGIAN